MIIDFSKIELKDIEGVTIVKSGLHKVIANLLYHMAESIDFVEPAICINKGEPVDLTRKEILTIKDMVTSPKSGVTTYARKSISDFVDAVLE